MSTVVDPAEIDRTLRGWHARMGRHLTIRDAAEPWALLVAEVMSQQTQIGRVGAAWEAFLVRWPTAADAARASTRDLLVAWGDLGYPRRALALRTAAREIATRYGGVLPASPDELATLPGVGRYTARAMAARAFGTPVAPVDVNVGRVVGRLMGRPATPREVEAEADRLISHTEPSAWIDAVMDLAATICTRRSPRCGECPLRATCPSRGTPGEPARARLDVEDAAAARPPFETTTRWLRGRLLRRLRESPTGTWVAFDEPVGDHDGPAIAEALAGLDRDGFVERDGTRARLREE